MEKEMTKHTFVGTDEQLINALMHMAEKRPITKAEKAICATAAERLAERDQ